MFFTCTFIGRPNYKAECNLLPTKRHTQNKKGQGRRPVTRRRETRREKRREKDSQREGRRGERGSGVGRGRDGIMLGRDESGTRKKARYAGYA
jgi:hypothetical protein